MPFAITNRKADTALVFGNVPGDTIFYGTVAPKGNAAGFSPVGQGTGVQAETELFKALKSKLAQTKRNVVFFVNGSGQDFGHAARIAAALEAEYGVEVVLLAWPSAENNLHKYQAHYGYARGAAPIFLGILVRWLDVLGGATALPASRQILFCHSLGNQVIEVIAQDPAFLAILPAYQSVVVNAADVDADAHLLWMSRLGARAYVVQNANDSVLASAEGGLLSGIILGENPMKGKKRLGKTMELAIRAPQATYVDVTKSGEAGKQHEYYIGLKSQGSLQALYLKLLTEKQNITDLATIAARDAKVANLWHLK